MQWLSPSRQASRWTYSQLATARRNRKPRARPIPIAAISRSRWAVASSAAAVASSAAAALLAAAAPGSSVCHGDMPKRVPWARQDRVTA